MLNNIVGLLGVGTPVSTNSYESIQTVTVGSGGSSSISFTSIPSTYKHLQIRGIGRDASTSFSSIGISLNNDNTGTSYSFHSLSGDGSAASSGSGLNNSKGYIGGVPISTQLANAFGASVIDILDYTNTNKNKTIRTLTGYDLNGSGQVFFASTLWNGTAAVTSIQIESRIGTNFLQHSTYALYGIKG